MKITYIELIPTFDIIHVHVNIISDKIQNAAQTLS